MSHERLTTKVAGVTGRIALMVGLVALPFFAASPAQALGVDLVCPFSGTVNFSPGLTLVNQPEAISGILRAGTASSPLTPCSSPVGVPYSGGTGVLQASGTLACISAGLGGSESGTVKVTWSNGDTSTISESATVNGLVPVVNAKVTAGHLLGDTVLVQAVLSGFNGNCAINPLKTLDFNGTVQFVS